MKPIPYGRQTVTEKDLEAVLKVLQSDFLTCGPAIGQFEKAFAQYIGVPYAVAVSSGTAALHLSAMALDVGVGTKVITSCNTFVASANCVLYCGGEIELVDIVANTGLIDLAQVEAVLASAPKGTYQGIIPVDFAGYPVDLESLRKIADQYGCWILEDSCHAPGGYFIDSKGEKQFCGNGKWADLSIFSFHPVKHIAAGEGGIITTSRKDLYEKMCMLRAHGITRDPELLTEQSGGWYYEMQMLGYNYRLSDIHAILGYSQLGDASERLKKRKSLARKYDQAFENTLVRPLDSVEGHAYHLYIIQVPKRKELYDHLRANGIFAQVHYIPVHYQPYYQQLGWRKTQFPEGESYYNSCLSLPLYPALSEDEQNHVIEQVLAFFLS